MMHQPTHFLLAEDDEDHAALIQRSMSRRGDRQTLDRVPDGVEAMRYLRREGEYANKPRPDVILLDLNMPRMGGHEVLELVKGDPALQNIPVVVFTTSDNRSDRDRAYLHNVNSYLVKPMEYEQLKTVATELGLYWGDLNRAAGPSGGRG